MKISKSNGVALTVLLALGSATALLSAAAAPATPLKPNNVIQEFHWCVGEVLWTLGSALLGNTNEES